MPTETERTIIARLTSLEQAVTRISEDAAAAREHAENTDLALNGRLKSLELWRARLEGAWTAAKVAWTLAGAGGGAGVTLLITKAIDGG